MRITSSRSFVPIACLALTALCSLVPSIKAAGAPPGSTSYVVYNPGTVQTMQGDTPFLGQYVLSVTSPSATPVGEYLVTLNKTVLAMPTGSDHTTAASFLAFSVPTLLYTGPNQTQTVTVTLTVPSGSVVGDFSYLISTSGWPTGRSIVDLGTTVNMTVQSSGSFPTPTVFVTGPEDNTVFARLVGGAPITVPITVSATAGESATLRTLVATVSGVATDGSLIPAVTLPLINTGLGTANASGTASFLAVKAGEYTVVAIATNTQGESTDTTTFVVREGRPPEVTITEPPDASYDYFLGSTPLIIPFTFLGHSFETGVTKLTAAIDGVPVDITPDDLGALYATGTGTLGGYSSDGIHVLTVTAEDIFGIATASTTFAVRVIRPTPTIIINEPATGTVLTLPTGATTMSVPFTFTANTSTNFTISSISAMLGGTTQAVPSQVGLGTVEAVGQGTLTSLPVGTYTLTAFGVSAGIQVQTSTVFTIVKPIVVNTPPTVVINTPAAGSTYTIASHGGCGNNSLNIPLTFTGTSTSAGAVITKLTATLDGSSLGVTSGNLNQKVSDGSATMSVSTAGTHTITVTATDIYGVATATRTFNVVIVDPRQRVSGIVFFDANLNGVRGTEDYGLSDVTVKLLNSAGQAVGSTVTNSSGAYTFTALPGSYKVSAASVTGMSLTTPNNLPITVNSGAVNVSNIGYGLNLNSINGKCANGFTIGYWKNNVDKAIANKSSGTQVSAATIKSYTAALAVLALDPFTGLTMPKASAYMSSNSSAPADLLAKQLVASEYNYANGAFIGGDRRLTYAFIYHAEYVLKNASSYGSAYVLLIKNWCDAYNNSHGGAISGP